VIKHGQQHSAKHQNGGTANEKIATGVSADTSPLQPANSSWPKRAQPDLAAGLRFFSSIRGGSIISGRLGQFGVGANIQRSLGMRDDDKRVARRQYICEHLQIVVCFGVQFACEFLRNTLLCKSEPVLLKATF
jgi:hypothetical protein